MKKAKLEVLAIRRHPLYSALKSHWEFLEATYDGGRAWFGENIFRYHKEGDKEYAERVKRAYRFNHTKQIVDLVDKYLFKMPIQRKDDAADFLKDFWNAASLSGESMDTFMRRVSNITSRLGRAWIVVDSTRASGDDESPNNGVTTIADAKAANIRSYAYIIKPQNALDMSYDDSGNLNWILFKEDVRDDVDPLDSSGRVLARYRLWTKTEWVVFGEQVYARGEKTRMALIDMGSHDLGCVPVVRADHVVSDDQYQTSGLIDDIAYLDRANANYLSNLDAIIQDQSFSQLVMPAQGLLPSRMGKDDERDEHAAVIEAGTNRIFTYDGESATAPHYISPDPRQASMILSAIGKIINEIYHSVGMSGERTKDDNGGGIDNSSGVAKAYDFERVNSLLAAKASTLQMTELQVASMVCRWNGESDAGSAKTLGLIAYPDKFDTRSLYDEFEIATRLSLLAAPDELRRKQMHDLATKLFPTSSESERRAMAEAIKQWPPKIELGVEGELPGAKSGSSPSNPNAAGEATAALAQKTAKEMATKSGAK